MSGAYVRKGSDLTRLATRIRHQHMGSACTCPCTCDSEASAAETAALLDFLPTPPPMDARERKWATEKLLLPVDPVAGEEGFTIEEEIEVCHQHWELQIAGASLTPTLSAERARFMARQFHETVRFARRAWGMHERSTAGRKADDASDDLAG